MASTTSLLLSSLTSSFSSLSLRPSPPLFLRHHHKAPSFPTLRPISHRPTSTLFVSSSEDPTFTSTTTDDDDPEGPEPTFEAPTPPEGYGPPPYFDEFPPESEAEVTAAYEEIYGPAYSGESVLGNNIYVMDAKVKKASRKLQRKKREKIKDGLEERVVQVRRVTKVVKGGKQMKFRAIVVVGDKQGRVGVGIGKAKEVISAVEKSTVNARRNMVSVPMTKYSTFPHRADGDYGAAKVMLRPASPGTGVIAGGAVKIVLEMAGVENALGKQLGSDNALNNARATIVAFQKMNQFQEIAELRGLPMEELWK